MPEVFHYPASYPALWLDYYFLATWLLGMLFLGLVWALFYRYGKFTYGVDLGCFWKTALLVLLTTVSLGGPMYYNTRFAGEHGQDGDSIKIAGDQLLYLDRKGNEKKTADCCCYGHLPGEHYLQSAAENLYCCRKTSAQGLAFCNNQSSRLQAFSFRSVEKNRY